MPVILPAAKGVNEVNHFQRVEYSVLNARTTNISANASIAPNQLVKVAVSASELAERRLHSKSGQSDNEA
jgi:hypothetical protein